VLFLRESVYVRYINQLHVASINIATKLGSYGGCSSWGEHIWRNNQPGGFIQITGEPSHNGTICMF